MIAKHKKLYRYTKTHTGLWKIKKSSVGNEPQRYDVPHKNHALTLRWWYAKTISTFFPVISDSQTGLWKIYDFEFMPYCHLITMLLVIMDSFCINSIQSLVVFSQKCSRIWYKLVSILKHYNLKSNIYTHVYN